ncbi:MAG: caspase family protein [Propylenella sp.]
MLRPLARKRWPSRLALVVGNSAYGQVGDLPNAERDAALIASRLEALGVEVHLHTNLEKHGMDCVFQAFVHRLREVGSADTVIFYFAGHGYQDGETNYLLPIIAKGSPFDSIPLQGMMEELSGLSRRRLVFLDACRESFNAERVEDGLMRARGLQADQRPKVRSGLADFAVDDETFISFSAAPGKTASDGVGGCPNSPYATALSRFINEVDLPLTVMMARVRNSVLHDTNETQKTWDSSSLESSFFFNPSSHLILIGNVIPLIASFVALASMMVVLAEAGFGVWFYVSLSVYFLAFSIFLHGIWRTYRRVRGEQQQRGVEVVSKLFARSIAGTYGAIYGAIGGIMASSIQILTYWYSWRDSNFCDEMENCPQLGLLITEGSAACIYISTLLGFFSMHFSEWMVRGRPGGVIKAPTSVRMFAGAILGGALAGVVVGPVITAYWGAQDRPLFEPGLVIVGSVLAAVLMAFCIVNYKLETFTRARLLRSFLGAGIGTICALLVLSGLGVFFYWTGFTGIILGWASTGFFDETNSVTERYSFLLVAGLPYGVVFGLSFGVLVAATRLFVEASVKDDHAPRTS